MNRISGLFKRIYMLGVMLTTISILFLLKPPNITLAALYLFGFFATAFMLILTSIKVLQNSNGHINNRLLWGGCFIILGGVFFDVINTIIGSPDLSLESNPIVLYMSRNRLSLNSIYLLGFLGQVTLITMATLLWAVFLKNFNFLVEHLKGSSGRILFYEIIGGKETTLFKLIIGKTNPFNVIMFCIPLFISIFIYRWYLGLEWLGLVPISRIIAPTVIICAAAVGYFICVKQSICKFSAR